MELNIFMTMRYNIEDSERVQIIMNWLGCEGFHLVPTLTEGEKVKHNQEGLFIILNQKFRHKHNDTTFYSTGRLSTQEHKSAEEQMGWLRIKANKCNYKEGDK